MNKTVNIIGLVLIVLLGAYLLNLYLSPSSGSSKNSVVVSDDKLGELENGIEDIAAREPEVVNSVPVVTEEMSMDKEQDTNESNIDQSENNTHQSGEESVVTKNVTSREIRLAESISLPLSGSAPTTDVRHSIPIEEIRRGCFRQDCIPSVDDPQFVSVLEANDILPSDTVGIALEYKGEERFYPFNMLVTREIVNDVVAGDSLLVTYCPLCGTGIVFDRVVDGLAYEFGVSGMLWQSNLLMYNRAQNLEDRNLWSQVLGEAVVGERTGTKLSIVPSNIVRYADWKGAHPNAKVLNTGRIGDPYGGQYYEVARNFAPNFDEVNSALDPSAYVYGVEIEGTFKAYPRDALPEGETSDVVAGKTLSIVKNSTGEVLISEAGGETVPDVEGFWFSWIAAHPDTLLWQK